MNNLISYRNIQLIWAATALPGTPTLTVEMWIKWYDLQLVHPDGRIERVLYPENLDGESSFIDHVPNPKAVVKFAKEKGYEIDELALQAIKGRWAEEHEQWE
jgi:hypothetical protein